MGFTPPFSDAQAQEVAIKITSEAKRLLRLARGHGHDIHDGQVMSELPLMARLQHAGASTPMLDVTLDPMVALFFACQSEPEEDGLLLAIDARSDRMSAFDLASTMSWDYASSVPTRLGRPAWHLHAASRDAANPRGTRAVPIRGDRHRRRVSALPVAQRPTWTYTQLRQLFGHHGAGRPADPPVVTISAWRPRHKQRLRDVLEDTFRLYDESLFPDLAGFAAARSVCAEVCRNRLRSSDWLPSCTATPRPGNRDAWREVATPSRRARRQIRAAFRGARTQRWTHGR